MSYLVVYYSQIWLNLSATRAHHLIFYIFLPGDKSSLLATNKKFHRKKHYYYYLFIGEIQPKIETEMINYFFEGFQSPESERETEKEKNKIETVQNFNIWFVVCSQKVRRMIKDFVSPDLAIGSY
jgi:hypothetical protein